MTYQQTVYLSGQTADVPADLELHCLHMADDKCCLWCFNPWLAAHINCRLPYVDSVAPDQPAHPRSLI